VYGIIDKRRKQMVQRGAGMRRQPSGLRVDGLPTDVGADQPEEPSEKDLLDLLLEAKDDEGDGEGFSNQQIMEEVMTIMVHTVATLVSVDAGLALTVVPLHLLRYSLPVTRPRASRCRGRFTCWRSTRRWRTSWCKSWFR
jgi:hypothetical protein